jgi:SAM-dependent methyltransferase
MRIDDQISVLENLEMATNYRKWLIGLASDLYRGDVFELGSGLGLYANDILNDDLTDLISKFHLSEIDRESLDRLKARFQNVDKVTIHDLNMELPQNIKANSFVSWNVIEHIEDDVKALQMANIVCSPGSKVFALVPAMPFAFSKFDRELNHYRRYSKSELELKAKLAGLESVEVKYVNGIGILTWLVFIKFLNLRPSNNLMLKIYDQIVVPIQILVERKMKLPFGQSLILRAKTSKSETL